MKVITCDIECYRNYLLVMFRDISSGKELYFEKYNNSKLNVTNILHILNKYTVVTFNGLKYDTLILEAATAGFTNEAIHRISTAIIADKFQPWQVRDKFGISALKFDHIDIKEVAPLQASLKIYAGRLHAKRLKDLPVKPEDTVVDSDLPGMLTYCGIDNDNTDLLFTTLKPEIKLRMKMGNDYGVDLRSKSDAQIAETVIKQELKFKYGIKAKRPRINIGTEYYFKPPGSIIFTTPLLKSLIEDFTDNAFIVGKSGHVLLPKILKNRKFKIGKTTYKVGVGGLHSCEKKTRHTNSNHIIRDYDAASYYPRIILNNELYPKHLGKSFLKIYESIVNRRLKAKKEKDKVTNESLKITINGSFGKLGSKWSCLYSPDLMMQVTITGQLSFLMLIEVLELNGIDVISANTDGIVIKMLSNKEELCESIVHDWEFKTGYQMEATDYETLNSRDVNNYIAIKTTTNNYTGKYSDELLGIKGKGAYADQRNNYYRLRTNPTGDIPKEAAKLFLKNKTPVETTIRKCKDITKFVTIRTVNGGAVKDGKLIGKAIRWYYGANELDAIYYNTTGNKVPKSDGAVPLMDLPEKFPTDVDFEWYVVEANRILKDVGFNILTA